MLYFITEYPNLIYLDIYFDDIYDIKKINKNY